MKIATTKKKLDGCTKPSELEMFVNKFGISPKSSARDVKVVHATAYLKASFFRRTNRSAKINSSAKHTTVKTIPLMLNYLSSRCFLDSFATRQQSELSFQLL